MEESVIPVRIEDEMKRSYMDYAMSVIVGRALPDVRDGLKPVHRRILYGMRGLGLVSNKPHKKSARIVGEVLGKYHPHGDVAVYDTMVRMAQDFSYRYMLVDGQGNFGSVDGDSAAAMRYTEARLPPIAEEMLEDLDKDTVGFTPNFDGSLEEPLVLPSKIPNLLVNGSSGIAVGMATNMPPHNLSEVVDGIVMAIDNPDVTVADLMQKIKGPDFPTGAFIMGLDGIWDAYSTGRGIIKLRARADIEEKGKKERIIVTEIPYQVNKSKLIEDIAALVREKRIDGISDLRDESDREGIRVVIELQSSANSDIVLNSLFKHTQMETTFGVINLALVGNRPVTLSLKDLIVHYIEHRKNVVIRRTEFELDKAEKRAHILEGLIVALDNIDRVIDLIRSSENVDDARKSLMDEFELSDEQVKAILDMRLQRLTGLEREKISEEHTQLLKDISRYKGVLSEDQKILDIIKEELLDIKDKYGDERRTEIIGEYYDMEVEDLIAEENMVVTITNSGYVKRLPQDTFKQQRRGGRGVMGMETKEEDFVEDLFVASTHDYFLFFTDQGRMHKLKVYEIPPAGRYARGKAAVNLLNLEDDERVTAVIPVKEFDEGHFLMMATDRGIVKKVGLSKFASSYKSLRAINLDETEVLVDVKLTDGDREIIMATRMGKAIRFSEKEVRSMGRTARGVIGIRLKEEDVVIAMDVIRRDAAVLTITENGYGKRTPVEGYSVIHRGGQGVINIKTSGRNGVVVGIKEVSEEDEMLITSLQGIVIRVPAKEISLQSRNTQGVRIMKLGEEDKVVALARVVEEEDV